ncbi:MAG TPA: hypothetical protein VK982_07075 [Bacteroidales bacterium]|nr:hypothetical protein [Bacteroidales bacterium]
MKQELSRVKEYTIYPDISRFYYFNTQIGYVMRHSANKFSAYSKDGDLLKKGLHSKHKAIYLILETYLKELEND